MPRDLFSDDLPPRDVLRGASDRPSSALDAVSAVASGGNQGLLRLLGMLPDAAYNTRDLLKAAIGTGWLAAGKEPPAMLEVGDRSVDPLSGDWLINKAKKAKFGNAMLTAQNPEFEGGHLQNIGATLPGLLLGRAKSGADLANQAALATASAVASKAAYDKTGSKELAILAGMAPGPLQGVAVDSVKRSVRGGEAGRQQMQQRIDVLKAAGVDEPTVGLATGNKKVAAFENLLANSPGSMTVMGNARDKAVAGMTRKAQEAADVASTNRGELAAGVAIQDGLRGFKKDFGATQERLYNNLADVMGPQFPTPISNTRSALASLNADIAGAPALSGFFKNGKLQSLEAALRADTSGSPASVMVYPQPPRAAGGLMNAAIPQDPLLVQIPQGPARNSLPFQAVKQTRSMVGSEIADSNLLSDIPRSKWNPLYGALTEDIRAGATNAGPAAASAFNRANDYSRAGYGRLERLAPVADRPAPEQSFAALEGTLRQNVSIFNAVKKSLPEGARGQVAGTIVEQLGKATPGQQNASGTAWSPDTFLTNWNRMTPEGRKALLAGFPNADQVARDVSALAKTAEMMRDNSKLWNNPSGTAASVTARGTIGAVGVGGVLAAAGVAPWAVPAVGAGGLLSTHTASRALTSPSVVKALANKTAILDPNQAALDYMGLTANGLLAYQPE